MFLHVLFFQVGCLLMNFKSSAALPEFPSISLRSNKDQPVPQHIDSVQIENYEPVRRGGIQPAVSIQQENNPLKMSPTNPVAKKSTMKPKAKPVVTFSSKPFQNPYCTTKIYDFKEEDEESGPCSTTSPSFKKSIQPTVSTDGPTTYPSMYPTTPLAMKPTSNPSLIPFENPSFYPTTINPTWNPSFIPFENPSFKPTQ